jgi:hypothetical protein
MGRGITYREYRLDAFSSPSSGTSSAHPFLASSVMRSAAEIQATPVRSDNREVDDPMSADLVKSLMNASVLSGPEMRESLPVTVSAACRARCSNGGAVA